MKKTIIYKTKNKKASEANWLLIGIIFVIALFIGFGILGYVKDSIFSIWSSVKSMVKSYQPDEYEYTPDQYVDEKIKNNVYSYIYVNGDADRRAADVKDFKIGLGSSFAAYKQLGSSKCDVGSEFPGTLSRSGCYILAAEDDSKIGGLGDDCAVNLYKPDVNGLILYDIPPIIPENKKQAKTELTKNCVSGYHCQSDALNLFYHFFNKADGGVQTSAYFDKSLVCASPRLGVYMWFKCDLNLAGKNPDNKIEIYGESGKVQYQCLCPGNSCSWSRYEEEVQV